MASGDANSEKVTPREVEALRQEAMAAVLRHAVKSGTASAALQWAEAYAWLASPSQSHGS